MEKQRLKDSNVLRFVKDANREALREQKNPLRAYNMASSGNTISSSTPEEYER